MASFIDLQSIPGKFTYGLGTHFPFKDRNTFCLELPFKSFFFFLRQGATTVQLCLSNLEQDNCTFFVEVVS